MHTEAEQLDGINVFGWQLREIFEHKTICITIIHGNVTWVFNDFTHTQAGNTNNSILEYAM